VVFSSLVVVAEMDAPKSPDTLQLRGTPNVGPRVGRRIALIAGGALILIMAVIIFNTEKRRQAVEDKPKVTAIEAAERLRPAAKAGEAMNSQISNEVKAVTYAEQKATVETAAHASLPVPNAAGETQVPPLELPNGQGAVQVPALTEAERALKQQKDAELKTAINAPSRSSNWAMPDGEQQAGAAGGNPADSTLQNMINEVRRNGAAAMQSAGAMGAPGAAGSDQNMQDKKRAFIDNQQRQLETPILATMRKAPPTPYMLNTGTVIPAVMEQGMNSDLPGELTALVSRPVYDSANGVAVLIPQGSKLFGKYDSNVSFGQSRALVVWQRVIYPDGSTLELAGMQGTSMNGDAGFSDQVDNHYGRMVGFGLMTSLFSAGFQLSQPQQSSTNGQLSSQQIVGGAVGQQITELGMEVTRRNLNIQPTIRIRPGYRFNVMVNRDIVFQAPYNP
jgi:type IV secretion system protein VirB10